LIEVLEHHSAATVRVGACDGLRALGPEAKAAIPALLEAIKDPDELVPTSAAFALGAIGAAATPDLVKLLEDADAKAAEHIGLALGGGGASDATLDRVVAMLSSAEPGQRLAAATAMGYLAGSTLKGHEPLLKLMDDLDPRTRVVTIRALDSACKRTESTDFYQRVIDRTTTALGDVDADVRREAAFTLYFMLLNVTNQHRGVVKREAIAGLIKKLDDPDPRVRESAADAMVMADVRRNDALQKRLIDLVKSDPDKEVRGKAAEALAAASRSSAQADEALAQAVKDDDPGVRIASLRGLDQNNPEKVMFLVDAMKDPDSDMQYWASHDLAHAAPGVIVTLCNSLEDVTRIDRKKQLEMLIRVLTGAEYLDGSLAGSTPARAITTLIALSRDTDPEIRAVAEKGLRAYAEKGTDVVYALVVMLRKADDQTRPILISFLATTVVHGEEHRLARLSNYRNTERLIETLGWEETEQTRQAVIESLSRACTDSKVASRVQQAKRDENPRIREGIEQVLAKTTKR
jgi:HEAT repeat protein